MTTPQMERRVYERDEPHLFRQLTTLTSAPSPVTEIDGVQYTLEHRGDDTVGAYYLLTPVEGQAAQPGERG